MEEVLVSYELKDEIALIGLNRPAKHNALSRELQAQLKAAAIHAGEEALSRLFAVPAKISVRGSIFAKPPPG